MQQTLSDYRARAAHRLASAEPEPVADGVWVLRGGFPQRLYNVYLIADGDGVTAFDAGIKGMSPVIASAAERLAGPLKRIVLGHGHTDHRGGAAGLDVPVLCHPDDVVDAEGAGGFRYWHMERLPALVRRVHLFLHRHVWDGGPLRIADTVSEGDEVAGFRVVHLPGHAPGLIALWRESDRLALTTDCFYLIDMWGRVGEPRVPHPAYNLDTAQARESMRKLASLEPSAAWPGHAGPLTGDVRAKLETAAAG
jgi:glyoxylase-like metal-dependent hydrolase (beta-lactamase superfamily II)